MGKAPGVSGADHRIPWRSRRYGSPLTNGINSCSASLSACCRQKLVTCARLQRNSEQLYRHTGYYGEHTLHTFTLRQSLGGSYVRTLETTTTLDPRTRPDELIYSPFAGCPFNYSLPRFGESQKRRTPSPLPDNSALPLLLDLDGGIITPTGSSVAYLLLQIWYRVACLLKGVPVEGEFGKVEKRTGRVQSR